MLANNIFPIIQVITNGTIKIPKNFNHRLFVSLEGQKRKNDLIRGKGIFSKVIKNYSGDKRVIINMTLKKDNYKELENVVKIARENNFLGVVCNLYTPTIGEKSDSVITKKDRKLIISELKRVKSVYPNDFLLSKAMIKWYEFPDLRGFCFWGDKVKHFDVSWNSRRYFPNLDCSNCGCLAGSLKNPFILLMHLKETRKIF